MHGLMNEQEAKQPPRGGGGGGGGALQALIQRFFITHAY